MNWFLYVVTEKFLDIDGELIMPGEAGVGQCSMSPGVMEVPHGIMYVVGPNVIKKFFKKRGMKHMNARNVRLAIHDFYFAKKEVKKNSNEFTFD